MQNETPARFVLVQQSRAFGRPRAGDPNFQAAALYRSVPLNFRAAGCNCQFARPGRGPDEGAAGRRPLIPRRVQNWNELRPAKATLALHIKDGYIFRMCKSSRRPFCPNAMVYPALLCVWAFAQTAQADPLRFDDKLCSDLAKETQEYVDQSVDGELSGWEADSPIIKTMDAAMAHLEDEVFWRVRHFLLTTFTRGCVSRWPVVIANLEKVGVPSDPTVGQVIDGALRLKGLDRSKPNLGLRPLPEIDFDTQTWDDVNSLLENVPPAEQGLMIDNILLLGFSEHMEKYDLSDPEHLERAREIAILLSFEGGTDETIGAILDRLAVEAGLRLK